jgi:site-specific recombinase XerD
MTDIVSIDDLLARSRELAEQTKSPATKKAYASDLGTFIRWCSGRHVMSLPAIPETIAAYIVDCERNGLAISSLSRALCAISQAHKLAGHGSPTSDPRVREVLKGLRRKKGTAQNRAKPLVLEQLVRVLSKLGPSIIDLRDKALLAIGWSCALRRSEIVALKRKDVESVVDGLVVNIRRSKTDQEGEGRKIGIPFGGEDFCPVEIIRRWLTIAQISEPERPIFFPVYRGSRSCLFVRRKTEEQLSDRSVSLIVKRALETAGYDAAGYSGHSLRAGFCTSAAASGVPEHEIMSHTGHKSSKIMRGYIREGSLFAVNPLNILLAPAPANAHRVTSPLQITGSLAPTTHQALVESPARLAGGGGIEGAAIQETH